MCRSIICSLMTVIWSSLTSIMFFWLLLVIKVAATDYFLLLFSLLIVFNAFYVGFLLVKRWPSYLVEGCLRNYWLYFICLTSLADIQTLLFYRLRSNTLLWYLRKGHWMLNQSLIIGNKTKLTSFFSEIENQHCFYLRSIVFTNFADSFV